MNIAVIQVEELEILPLGLNLAEKASGVDRVECDPFQGRRKRLSVDAFRITFKADCIESQCTDDWKVSSCDCRVDWPGRDIAVENGERLEGVESIDFLRDIEGRAFLDQQVGQCFLTE